MEEMKRYMGRTKKDRIVIAIVGIVCGVLGVVQIIESSMVVGVILAAVCLLLLVSAIFAGKQDAVRINVLAERGEMDAAVTDFKAAEDFAEGMLKIGQRYAFRKGAMEVLALHDVKNVYIKWESDSTGDTYGAEHPVIFVGLKDGRSVILCRLYGNEQDELLRNVIEALHKRVPDLDVQ